jgi:plastocyanin
MRLAVFIFVLAVSLTTQALAGNRQVELVAKDGTYSPTEVVMAPGEKIDLIVKNQGSDAEEFESIELKREKIVAPGKSITVRLGPLKAGAYPFFGDFHPGTAKGKVVVKEATP